MLTPSPLPPSRFPGSPWNVTEYVFKCYIMGNLGSTIQLGSLKILPNIEINSTEKHAKYFQNSSTKAV